MVSLFHTKANVKLTVAKKKTPLYPKKIADSPQEPNYLDTIINLKTPKKLTIITEQQKNPIL